MARELIVESRTLSPGRKPAPMANSKDAQLVLLLGHAGGLASAGLQRAIQVSCPKAYRIGCAGTGPALEMVALTFYSSRVEPVSTHVDRHKGDSAATGEALGNWLDPTGLKHVLVFASESDDVLLEGLRASLGRQLPITGAFASGPKPLVRVDDRAETGQVVAVGLYGRKLQTGLGAGSEAWIRATEEHERTPDFSLVVGRLPTDHAGPIGHLQAPGIGPSRRGAPLKAHRQGTSITTFYEG